MASFLDQLRDVDCPSIPQFQVQLESVQLWLDAIRGLKSSKTHGIDGWRYEELKKLAGRCIADLAYIHGLRC